MLFNDSKIGMCICSSPLHNALHTNYLNQILQHSVKAHMYKGSDYTIMIAVVHWCFSCAEMYLGGEIMGALSSNPIAYFDFHWQYVMSRTR